MAVKSARTCDAGFLVCVILALAGCRGMGVAKKGVLNCDGLSDWSLHSIGWSCVALSSCDAISARFRIFFVNTSKNVTIFLEPGTNVKILSHRHIIFLGSAWSKPEFKNLARSWVLVLGSGFQVFQFRLGTTLSSPYD